MASNYAPSTYIDNITKLENDQKQNISETLPSSSDIKSISSIWDPKDMTINSPTLQQFTEINNDYLSKYSFTAFQKSATHTNTTSINVGCKTPVEYSTTSSTPMQKIDDGYFHTFESCRNKAVLMNKPYFAVTKPPSTASNQSQYQNQYNCYVSDTVSGDNSQYYDYVEIFNIGGNVTLFGLSQDGDIIMDGIDIPNAQNAQFSNKTEVYTFGGNTAITVIPSNTPVELENVYIFNITQVNIVGATIVDSTTPSLPPVSTSASVITRVPGMNNKFIIAAPDNTRNIINMMSVELNIILSKLNARVMESKQITTGKISTITITSTDNWLQISELKVVDEDEVDVSITATATSNGTWSDARVTSGNANDNNNKEVPYYRGYHSGSMNGEWKLTLQRPTVVKQIIYYNRSDCCWTRAKDYTLTARDEAGKTVYSTGFNTDMKQVFNVDLQNINITKDNLNNAWNSSSAKTVSTTPIGQVGGLQLQGLKVSVLPNGYKEKEAGFTITENSAQVSGGHLYKKLTGITESECKKKCIDDIDCISYSTKNKRTVYEEGPPTEVGYFRDNWDRAMENWYRDQDKTGGNSFTEDYCLAKTKEKNPNDRYFALQYYGHCFSSNKDPGSGYARYGSMSACGLQGGSWCNRVFKRNTIEKSGSDCLLYNEDRGITSSPGSTVGVRNKIASPINNTGGKNNLTNNMLTTTMPLCETAGCMVYLQLTNNGYIELYRKPSSSVPATKLWSSQKKYPHTKQITPIPNPAWKSVSSNDILTPGEFIGVMSSTNSVATPSRTSLTSQNGMYKLEIVNGNLVLKASVYGCLSSDPTYKDTNMPLYTQERTQLPNSYYVYNAKLGVPKIDQPYFQINAPGGKTAIRPIRKDSNLLVNTDDYVIMDNYKPTNKDVNMAAGKQLTLDECKSECNASPSCNYAYVSTSDVKAYTNNNKDRKFTCYLGNQTNPAYIGAPYVELSDPNFVASSLLKRKQKLNIPNAIIDTNYNTTINYNSYNPMDKVIPANSVLGPEITTINEMDRYTATAPGKWYQQRYKESTSNTTTPTASEPAPNEQNNNLPDIQEYQQTQPTNKTTSLGGLVSSSIVSSINTSSQGFKNIESFDTHSYKIGSELCGVGGNISCQTDIKFNQIDPLKKIAVDYGYLNNRLNSQYSDISSNIGYYKTLYQVVDASNILYDFSYNIIPDQDAPPIDINMVRKNDSTDIALQTNNMYIAGSMLTTAILITAIYLGRS